MAVEEDEDKHFMASVLQNVTPLKSSGRVLLPPKRDKVTTQKKRIELSASGDETNKYYEFSDKLVETVKSDTELLYVRGHVPPKTIKVLRQGRQRPSAHLDLHGMTIAQARTVLSQFLTNCVQKRFRCVHLIHGRGKLTTTPPILKNHINSWLRQHPRVLAFCSAVPRDGGRGAVYILLKRDL